MALRRVTTSRLPPNLTRPHPSTTDAHLKRADYLHKPTLLIIMRAAVILALALGSASAFVTRPFNAGIRAAPRVRT